MDRRGDEKNECRANQESEQWSGLLRRLELVFSATENSNKYEELAMQTPAEIYVPEPRPTQSKTGIVWGTRQDILPRKSHAAAIPMT